MTIIAYRPTHARRLIAALCIVAIMTAFAPPKAYGQDIGGAVTLGVFLNKLADQINQIVLNAGNVGNAVAMEGGRQAALVVSDAQAAYKDSLNQTIDALSPQVKNTTDALKSLVDDLQNGAVATVDLATQRAQQIINALPFANLEPQVTSVRPSFVPPSTAVPVTVRLLGNFPTSARPGYGAYLMVDGKRFDATSNETQALTFTVPRDALFGNVAASPNRVSFKRVLAVVPWETTAWFGLRHIRHEDQFSLIVGALPSSPGRFTLVHTVTQALTQTRTFQGQNHHQASTREAGNNDDINHVWEETPDPGYSVVRNTSRLVVGSAQGDWSNSFVSDDANRVRYSVTTIHHTFGSSGSVDFHIEFQEATTQTVSNDVSEPLALNWGDSKSFSYPAGTWKLLFDSFDGRHFEIAGSQTDNPFITLANQNGTMVVGTKDVATLRWP